MVNVDVNFILSALYMFILNKYGCDIENSTMVLFFAALNVLTMYWFNNTDFFVENVNIYSSEFILSA